MTSQERPAADRSIGLGGTGSLEHDTFSKLLLHHAQKHGDRPALREKSRGIWRTTTWRQLADEADALAAALAAGGLQRGDHVALVGDNRPRLYAAMSAAHLAGATVVPLYQDVSVDELAHAIRTAEATHVFAENQEQVDKLLEVLPQCPGIRRIVYDDDRGMRHYRLPQLVSYDDLLKQGGDLAASGGRLLDEAAARSSGGDAAFLFFTSGTTGPAKGVVLTHASLIDRARAAVAAEDLKDTDVALAYLAPGWIGQNFFSYVQPMVAGYCVCCPESSETVLADLREVGPTYFLATPRVLEALMTQVSLRIEDTSRTNRALYRLCMRLAKRVGARILSGEPVGIGSRLAYAAGNLLIYAPLRDVLGMSRIRTAYTAGDVVAPELLMYFRSIGVNLKQLYGSTETGFLVATQRNGEVKPETVGRAVDGVELTFSPQREILVRSTGLFREYHGDPETTARVRNAEGWYHTGDAGYLGDDGHLRIIDRMEYLGALADGSPYSPRMIENKLKFSPYIREAVVFGDGRDKVCALIDMHLPSVGRWADRREISYTGHADLASRDEVYGLIADAIAAINAELAREPALAASQIHRFAILPRELSTDGGLLTHTGKLRRGAIAEHFAPVVDAIYAGVAEIGFDAGDGEEEARADLKIRDAKVRASPRAREAA